jgi:hypothetical protein
MRLTREMAEMDVDTQLEADLKQKLKAPKRKR